ncbi:polysaccharide deacetylase family protein [Azoarcus olearius]|uniref:Conserved hypothetical polysaccharide deacetylase n=1 Tax=Azoarcus sp. (strain BH72) TaxID=418699 RepID=A1KAM6_AZOSB|nr:polysaccharide deacetylase family protein [Azoarcus olearius]CAL95882.1 conserved hypothetical polysaccharide deacetylase [Azoarcus olearius]
MNAFSTLAALMSPSGPRARLSILIFHRVAPRPDPLFPGEVDAHRFDGILRWVSGAFRVLPLGQAVELLRQGRLPARAMAITFDDGYADNHDVALPILQRHGLSATFFVATDFLDGGRMWNDTVIEAVRRAQGGVFDLRDLALGCFDLKTPEAQRAAIDTVLTAIKHRAPEERARVVAEIGARAGAALPDDLMMTSAQVRRLHDAGMEIGGHTCSHPILAAAPSELARREIEDGKRRLETIIGASVDLFAYPNGRPAADYRAEHVEMVRAAGFKAAVSTAAGAAHAATDLFQLPRFTPWDRSPMRFGLRLMNNLRRLEHAQVGA